MKAHCCPTRKHIFAALGAGLILFVWGFFSWEVLPWHQATAQKFTDEAAVMTVLQENAPEAGVYFLPFAMEEHAPGKAAAFANVLPDGFSSDMGSMMAWAFVGNVIAALLTIALLQQTAGLGYRCRVCFVAVVGLTIGFVGHFPYWVWFGFSTSYVVVMIAETVIGWALAGLLLAKCVSGKEQQAQD